VHSTNSVKLATAQQVKRVYQFKNIKLKVNGTNTAIWYNKISRQTQLTAHCISIKINGAYLKWNKSFEISML